MESELIQIINAPAIWAAIIGFIIWTGKSYFESVEKQKTIRYAKLFEKRVLITEELYELLTDFESKMNRFTSPLGYGEEHREKLKNEAALAGEKFKEYSNKKMIFFNDKTSKLLNEINKKFKDLWIDFTTFSPYDQDSNITPEEKRKAWKRSWDIVRKEIPLIKEKLENEFRKTLGIN